LAGYNKDMSVKKGLGKGFDSLVPVGVDVSGVAAPVNEKIHHLSIDIVKPKSNQPRQQFNEQLLRQLAQSIKEQGILQPIIVTRIEHNSYSIVAGERRWRAAQLAGLDVIPAIIKQVDELKHLELALLENIQRTDLNAIETAVSINRLHKEFQQSYEDIASRLGKAYTTVVNTSRLLQLPENMQQAIISGEISEGHGRSLLALTRSPELQALLFSRIKSHKMSVRQAEEFVVKARQSGHKGSPAKPVKTTSDVEEKLAAKFGVSVKVTKNKNKGKIILNYTTARQYQDLINKLNG
jgi:ParB family transcriptional regulator, chromosome partitioning protein